MSLSLHQHAVGIVAKLMRERTGQVIGSDRRWRIDGAIEAVLRKRGAGSSGDILALLTQPDSAKVEQELVEALLNNETYFFRDRQVFSYLARNVLPALCKARAGCRTLRIWSAGCSTGQEPLSLAMMLIDEGLTASTGWSVELVATDVSQAAIDFAKRGLYSRFEIQRGLGVAQMLRHFTEAEDGWQASRSLLNTIRYHRTNLLDEVSTKPFDLILCRNLMLYLGDDSRRAACDRLRAALALDGRLLLGGGEASLDRTSGFVPAAQGAAIYRAAARALAA